MSAGGLHEAATADVIDGSIFCCVVAVEYGGINAGGCSVGELQSDGLIREITYIYITAIGRNVARILGLEETNTKGAVKSKQAVVVALVAAE